MIRITSLSLSALALTATGFGLKSGKFPAIRASCAIGQDIEAMGKALASLAFIALAFVSLWVWPYVAAIPGFCGFSEWLGFAWLAVPPALTVVAILIGRN
jgi:hypothetical protein